MADLRQPPAIEAYGGGGFRVNGVRLEGSILILDDAAHLWGAGALETLTPTDFAQVIAAGPEAVEFVLLGTGTDTAPAPREARDALRLARLGLEVMSTPEACRLYNILARDGRRIACCLLAV